MTLPPNNAFAAVRPVRNLVIIEAPGKLQALTFALKKCGLDSFHVLATQGHICDYPGHLKNLGINTALQETGRQLMRPQIARTIGQWAEKAQRILIATDGDQEGDVIAQDVVQLLAGTHPHLLRVRLKSLDVEAISIAFANPGIINPRDAWPGTARRIIDRLIGATFSGVQDNGLELSTGRVQTALLGAVGGQELATHQCTLVIPAQDGREPFVATFAVQASGQEKARQLVGQSEQFIREGLSAPLGKSEPAPAFKPWCYGEGVSAIALASGRTLEEVAGSMQRLYENGQMSYPRSGANAMTPQAIGKIERIAERNGVRMDTTRIAQFSRQNQHAHESPHPLGQEADLCSPLLLLSKDEMVLALLARHLVACGQPHLFQMPEEAALPAWAQDQTLQFKRRINQWLNPWPRRKAEPGLRAISANEHAMNLLLAHDLGRPSTQVGHAGKFASRGLLTADMALSDKARAWIAASPQVLLDTAVSSRIERIISDSASGASKCPDPAVLIRDLLEGLGLWPQIEMCLAKGRGFKSGLEFEAG